MMIKIEDVPITYHFIIGCALLGVGIEFNSTIIICTSLGVIISAAVRVLGYSGEL